jgi:hypothetical protein
MRHARGRFSAVYRSAVPAVPAVLMLLAAGFSFSGCGGGAPFKIVPVSGKVTYKGGSLIPADRIVVTFVPQGVPGAGKEAATAAQGDLNVADGTFAGLTTHKHMDGAIIGKHKVTVQALKTGPGGVGQPINVVPLVYTRAETTPLSVEVTGSGNNFPLEIDKAR